MASNPTTSAPSTDTLILSNLLLFIDKLDDSNYHTWAFDTSLWIIRLDKVESTQHGVLRSGDIKIN
ncbi:hypothetical protein JHK87_039742 [Glycine soja]|nr:hypothetical protein JHK87_039742 [Glycine soja]